MIEWNSFICGDCMDYLPEFPDKHFDLAVVDVPYGIGEDGSKNHTRSNLAKSKDYKGYAGNDLKAPDKEYFDELFRVSKNQIIWGANHFISKIPYDSPCWIVWNKENGESDFADCELAWTSFSSAVRIFNFRWQGMLQGDMKNKEHRIHPNQKPVALYEWLLSKYAKLGGGYEQSLIPMSEAHRALSPAIRTDLITSALRKIRTITDWPASVWRNARRRSRFLIWGWKGCNKWKRRVWQ